MQIRQNIGFCIWSLGLQIPGTLMVPAIKEKKKKEGKKDENNGLEGSFFFLRGQVLICWDFIIDGR